MSSQKENWGTVWAVLALLLALIVLSSLMGSQTAVGAKPDTPSTILINWHTFLGSEPASPGGSDDDQAAGVALDSAGYAYVVGQSIGGDWGGTVVITHTLGLDGFLAKLDSQGSLLWHTFIGGSETDSAQAITTDGADNLFVLGTSNGGQWSSQPISDSHGSTDLFVAKFDTDGERQWVTFVGTDNQDFGQAIAVDDAGYIFVGGKWVTNPYLAQLNSAGEFQWQRIITSTEGDLGHVSGIAVDQSGDVYVTGLSNYGDWHGASPPVRPHSGPSSYGEAFVAKFDGDDGTLLWHTFLGAADWEDQGHAIVLRERQVSPAVYVAGGSSRSWGAPLQPHSGFSDGFVAQLDGTNGTLAWHTFMGGDSGGEEIHTITLDGEERLFVAGASRDGWGRPVIPHPGGGIGDAAFVAALSADGHFLGHTFVGGAPSSDAALGIAASDQGDLYVAGTSWSPDSVGWNNPYWGAPIRPFSGTHDGFVAGLGVRSVIRYWVFAPIIHKP